MLHILDSMEDLKLRLLTDDYGKHLMGVEDLLQKHSLLEADINLLGERVKNVASQSQKFLSIEPSSYHPCEPAIVIERVQQLEDAFSELVRRGRLFFSMQVFYKNFCVRFAWQLKDVTDWTRAGSCGSSIGTPPRKSTGSKKRRTSCPLRTLDMTLPPSTSCWVSFGYF